MSFYSTLSFRAKRLNPSSWEDPWAFGLPYILNSNTLLHVGRGIYVPIVQNTLSQSTGLFDSSKHEIFLGDIVDLDDYGTSRRGLVSLSDSLSSIVVKCNRTPKCVDIFPFVPSVFLNCSIVGNVFDNPDLLEVFS